MRQGGMRAKALTPAGRKGVSTTKACTTIEISIAGCPAHRAASGTLRPYHPVPPSMHCLTPSLGRTLCCLWLLISGVAAPLEVRADEFADVQRLYYSGHAPAAMQRADQFLVATPGDPQMRFMKGVMLADQKREAEAIVVFQRLTEDYPDLAEPYNNLAALYAASGDYPKARVMLEQALRTNPTYATAHENLGDVYAALAAQSYARALKLDASNVTVPPKLALVRGLYQSPSTEPAAASVPAR